MDIGSTPNKKFSEKYQAGSLSFEFASNGKNFYKFSYFEEITKFNQISKSSVTHNVLMLMTTHPVKKKNSVSNLEVEMD